MIVCSPLGGSGGGASSHCVGRPRRCDVLPRVRSSFIAKQPGKRLQSAHQDQGLQGLVLGLEDDEEPRGARQQHAKIGFDLFEGVAVRISERVVRERFSQRTSCCPLVSVFSDVSSELLLTSVVFSNSSVVISSSDIF